MVGCNFTVDLKGYVKKVEENNQKYDVLYTEECWLSGLKDTFVEIPIGVLGRKKTDSGEGNDGTVYTFDMYTIKGYDKATEVFEFLASNTHVEWSQTFVGNVNDETCVISTSHVENTEAGQAYLLHLGWTILAHNHSHPFSNNPSRSDKIWANAVNKKFPNAVLKIYYKNSYYKYDKDGLLSFPNLKDDLLIIDTKIKP